MKKAISFYLCTLGTLCAEITHAEPVTLPTLTLSGIKFPIEYKRWQTSCLVFRTEKGFIRAILSKMSWNRSVNKNWLVAIASREYWQVKFMTKKYNTTKYLGLSHSKEKEFKLWSEDKNFTQRNLSSHTPIANRDSIFTRGETKSKYSS
ncbi:MAG: hypothetical protein KAH20_06080 [Methylococcales bacterium]|nr:hypothetical protein [Methylococcales bacterium]